MPARKGHIPQAGDIVWLQLKVRGGRKQLRPRLAVVLSPASYNERAGLLLCCPVVSQAKGYPFEVFLRGEKPAVALADQVNSLDWRMRPATFKGKVLPAELAEIRHKATLLLNAGKN